MAAMNSNKSGAKGKVSQIKSSQEPSSKRSKNNAQRKPKNPSKPSLNIIVPEKMGSQKQLVQMETDFKHYVTNILKVEENFLLPRVGTTVAPHRYNVSFPVTPPNPLGNPTVNGAIAVFPNPNRLLLVSSPGQNITDSPLVGGSLGIAPAYNIPVGGIYMLNTTLLMQGQNIVSASVPYAGSFSLDGTNILNNTLSYYPGSWTIPNANLSMTVSWFAASINVQVVVGHLDGSNTPVIDGTGTNTPLTAFNVTTVPMPAVDFGAWIANAAAGNGIFIGLQFPNGGNFGYFDYIGMYLNNFTLTQGLQWTPYSLWQLIVDDLGSSKIQFNGASRVSITGLSFLFENTTPMLNAGGDIYGARLPGNSLKIPGSINQLTSRIQSQVHDVMRTHKLINGLHWSYTPEKVQDWLFYPPTNYSDPAFNASFPYLVMTYFAPIIAGANPTFNISINIMMEYITLDPTNTFIKSPHTPGLFEALLESLSNAETLGENPSHLQKISDIVKRCVTSDTFKCLAQSLIQAGVKVAPQVLSMFA